MLEPIIRLIHFLKEGKRIKLLSFSFIVGWNCFVPFSGGGGEKVYLRHLDLVPPLSSLNPFPDEIETEKEGRQKKRTVDWRSNVLRFRQRVSCNQNWAGCCRLLSPNYETNRADSFLIVRCRHHVSKHLALNNSKPFVFSFFPPFFSLKLRSRFSNIGRGWKRYCKSFRFNHADPELYWRLYSAATSGWASKHQDEETGWIWSRHVTITSSSDLIFSSDGRSRR